MDTSDWPAVLQTMIDYLTDFDAIRQSSSDGRELARRMGEKYEWKMVRLLNYAARKAFQRPRT